MAKKLVRCVEGHVYDAAEKACPVCGALPEPPAPAKKPAEPRKTKSKPAGDKPAFGGHTFDVRKAARDPRAIGGAAAALAVLLLGAWALGLFSAGDGIKTVQAPDKAPATESPATEKPATQTVRTGQAPVDECDRLAAAPEDPDRPQDAPGVENVADIQSNAVNACQGAIREHPGERRFQTNLARAYRKLGQDTLAVAAYRQASKQGSPFATWAIGRFTRDGVAGLTKNHDDARKILLPLAEQGLPIAMVDYGEMLLFGWGGPVDITSAEDWMTRAAQNNVAAFNRYLDHVDDGRFGEKDSLTKRRLLEHGVDIGSPNAMNDLGVLYHNATGGVPRNYMEAGRLYALAAERGSSMAIVNMGVMFENGTGVDRNYSEAWRLYDRAAALGNTEAMINLGNMSRDGRGVNRDVNEAAKWYQRAWEKKDATGLWRLVVLYDKYASETNTIEMARQALQAARGSYTAREELASGNGLSRALRAAVQSELQTKGFYTGTVDGRFGAGLRDALQAFLKTPGTN